MNAYEVNFDGLVGPTHNYSGLSFGNVASMNNQQLISNPRDAALQGLDKMYALMKLGIKQGILPPQQRPHFPTLCSLGFPQDHLLESVQKENPELLLACSSAACMWTANAATVSPSADSQDGRVHFTAANLSSKFHRSIEANATFKILQAIFSTPSHFVHHPPLPQGIYFADEGAANHSRFCRHYGDRGIQLFVYGRSAFKEELPATQRFPARQTLEASQAIVRLHKIPEGQVVFAQQNPAAIDAGVFHNDVISVGNQNLFFYHEQAFINTSQVIAEIQQKFLDCYHFPLILVEMKAHEISLQDAVATYLFNSQILTKENGDMVFVAPQECRESPIVHSFLQKLVESGRTPIKEVIYFNLRQSMKNGGGPACLRLRVVLTESELLAMNPHVLLTEQLYSSLQKWILRHYQDQLRPSDLADPLLAKKNEKALEELYQLLHLNIEA